MTGPETPHIAQYHSVPCGYCGSRRTGRMPESSLYQCATCGEVGPIRVNRGAVTTDPTILRRNLEECGNEDAYRER